MNYLLLKIVGMKSFFMLAGISFFSEKVFSQQFNSDSWLSKPHGMVTIIPTWGERNSMLMTTFSLFPKWEFTTALYQYNNDGNPLTDDGHSSTIYGKYMFYENKTQTGGASVKAGRSGSVWLPPSLNTRMRAPFGA